MKRVRILLVGALALLALGALVAALGEAQFRGGKSLPSPPTPPPPAQAPLPALPYGWLALLLRVLFLASLALVVLSLFFRKLRRYLLQALGIMAVLVLLWYGLQRWPKPEPEEAVAPPPAPSGPAATTPGEAGEWGPVRPPEWSIYVGALALGVLAALWLGPQLWERWARARQAQALEDMAREARAALLQGAPVQDVVVRCWLRMVEILSRRSGAADQPHLTPREFAQALARLGFRDEAISRLTQLFEEVRYGHKDSESRREQALAALAALERTYG